MAKIDGAEEFKHIVSKIRPSDPAVPGMATHVVHHSLQTGLPCGIMGEKKEGWTGGNGGGKYVKNEG